MTGEQFGRAMAVERQLQNVGIDRRLVLFRQSGEQIVHGVSRLKLFTRFRVSRWTIVRGSVERVGRHAVGRCLKIGRNHGTGYWTRLR